MQIHDTQWDLNKYHPHQLELILVDFVHSKAIQDTLSHLLFIDQQLFISFTNQEPPVETEKNKYINKEAGHSYNNPHSVASGWHLGCHGNDFGTGPFLGSERCSGLSGWLRAWGSWRHSGIVEEGSGFDPQPQ